MDYEKKIREYLNSSEVDQLYKSMLLNLFPELKESESEDERIRKEIIDIIDSYDVAHLKAAGLPSRIPEYIAWLEKKGEQKLNVNDNAKEMFIKALECVEEQNAKGYKLTDCDKNSCWEDFKAYTSCIVEQKPWSEEDERLRTSCIKHIEEELERIRNDKYGHSEIISDLKESCRERINWLESLKDRYARKPSDAHYELEEFAKIVRCNLTGISKAVQKLFEAKYLQLTGRKMYEGFKD